MRTIRLFFKGLIHEFRGTLVMLDADLAAIYGYSTKQFNLQVKRNFERFNEEDLMFQLSADEANSLRFQIATSNRGGRKYAPYAFTEQGVKTLALVRNVPSSVRVTVLSDNTHDRLHAHEVDDFRKEFPDLKLTILSDGGIFHDRYIIIDYGSANARFYHCGASSKDGGNKVMSIDLIADSEVYFPLIDRALKNPPLRLK